MSLNLTGAGSEPRVDPFRAQIPTLKLNPQPWCICGQTRPKWVSDVLGLGKLASHSESKMSGTVQKKEWLCLGVQKLLPSTWYSRGPMMVAGATLARQEKGVNVSA